MKYASRIYVPNALLSLVAMSCVLSMASSACACSTFCLNGSDHLLFGRSYDWHFGDGMIVVNQRGYAKTAELMPGMEDKPAKWTSKYGSITFNQYGREFPIGGMNEKGLVVETLWLMGTIYPTPDDRPAMDVLTWIQYHLDTCSTVDEVIKSQEKVRITPMANGALHYMVADPGGDVAIIEFLNGKAVCTPVESPAKRVLTNTHYEGSLEGLKGYETFGGKGKIEIGTGNSLHRFAALSERIRSFKPATVKQDVEYAFNALNRVRWKMTVWQMVYDVTAKKIYYRTPKHEAIRVISLEKFSFDNNGPVKVLDMHEPLEGDIETKFVDYSTDFNRKIAIIAIRKTPHTKDMPEDTVEQHILYPESELCQPVGKANKEKKRQEGAVQ